MADLLRELGVEIPQNGQIFCPFHDNTRTEAAKYYEDTNKVWCFAEQKMYHAYDAMRLLEYSFERIAAMVPDDISGWQPEEYELKFPIVPEVIYNILASNLKLYLFTINEMWKNREHIQCRIIK